MIQDPIISGPHPSGQPGSSARIVAVASELAEALRGLVDAIPGHPRRAQEIARALKLDKTISHRLVTAIREADPLATAHRIPGPEPLRRIAKAAGRYPVPAVISERVERAIAAFESLIKLDGGDRSGLDALISTWLPDAREHLEKDAKQSIYRGARQLKGVAAEVHFAAHLLHPSATPAACDAASVFGYLGLRRIRREATLKLGILHGTTGPQGRVLTLTRQPVEGPHDILWHEFCSKPEIEVTVRHIPETDHRVYELEWRDAVGPSSARNVVMRDLVASALRRYRRADDPAPRASINEVVSVPARTMVFDVLLHADLFPDWQPQLRTMETGTYGIASPNDRTRDSDVLPVLERVESLGWGLERFWAEEVPGYTEMLRAACETLGWDPQQFRGYRTRIEYPIFGSQLQLAFDVPVKPSDTPANA